MLTFFFCNICRCIEQINKANRGEISQDELQERQVTIYWDMLLCSLVCSFKSSDSVKLFFMLFVQNKAMQDPEIQNILTDPIMRQVLLSP